MWIIPTKQQNDLNWETLRTENSFSLQKYSPSKSILGFFIGTLNSLMMSTPHDYRIVVRLPESSLEANEVYIVALENSKKEIYREWNELEKRMFSQVATLENDKERLQFILSKMESFVTSNYSIFSSCNL